MLQIAEMVLGTPRLGTPLRSEYGIRSPLPMTYSVCQSISLQSSTCVEMAMWLLVSNLQLTCHKNGQVCVLLHGAVSPCSSLHTDGGSFRQMCLHPSFLSAHDLYWHWGYGATGNMPSPCPLSFVYSPVCQFSPQC